MKNIKINGERWYKGELTVKYNLKTLLKLLLLLIAFPFKVVWYILKTLWAVLVWLAKKGWLVLIFIGLVLAAFWKWLSPKLAAFWVWLRNLFNKKRAPEPTTGKKNRKWWWLIPALLAFLLAVLCFRSCGEKQEKVADVPVVVYEKAFDQVVVARAYLDGVQEKTAGACPRALVGFKFINDKSVVDYNFAGMTYDEAVSVVAEDWKPVVLDNLNPDIELSEQQMAVVTLVAMRMGKYGFARSTFLAKVNEGNFDEAGNWLLLQDANGNIRKTGNEPKQYFYVLRLLWNNELDIDELLDFPMFSYKGISVGNMYDAEGNYMFDSKIKAELKRGSFPRVAKALGL